MSKLTEKEMEIYNKSTINFMRELRKEIHEEEKEKVNEQTGRIITAVVINCLSLFSLALIIVKSGILFRFGIFATIVVALVSLGTCVYLVYKWFKDDGVEEEVKDFDDLPEGEVVEVYDEPGIFSRIQRKFGKEGV